jgi:hypothetical protein
MNIDINLNDNDYENNINTHLQEKLIKDICYIIIDYAKDSEKVYITKIKNVNLILLIKGFTFGIDIINNNNYNNNNNNNDLPDIYVKVDDINIKSFKLDFVHACHESCNENSYVNQNFINCFLSRFGKAPHNKNTYYGEFLSEFIDPESKIVYEKNGKYYFSHLLRAINKYDYVNISDIINPTSRQIHIFEYSFYEQYVTIIKSPKKFLRAINTMCKYLKIYWNREL